MGSLRLRVGLIGKAGGVRDDGWREPYASASPGAREASLSWKPPVWTCADCLVLRSADSERELARDRLAVALVRTGEGNSAAFQSVYELTSAKLFGICLRICGDRAAAEDVLAETYLAIWKHAGAYEPGRASPIAWLATLARNRAIDWLRSSGRRAANALEEAYDVVEPSVSAETALLTAERHEQLRQHLGALGETERWAIQTAFFDGSTYAELAELRGIPLPTMKSKIRRGLMRLRRSLDGVGISTG